ncbi:helix-turn-helix domain-containing protein [Curtobacterium sp. PhB78]|uniref:AraC family transcriptional regulator n=1 Tax=Curtobacterium sp. PhB78 TaxID=2485102 RepID=UPI000F48EE81|nr:helix-turn-helix transcriptional regulator [Curtobacterium sp. PhB78]ROS36255.1 AraC-like DNA-binding protein [Curtobacterium sp. PhB78]
MSDSSQVPVDARTVDLRTEAAFAFAHAETVPTHTHPLGHLVHAASGVLSLITDDGAWIAPPNRVAWVPAGAEHRHRAHGVTDMRVVFLSADAATGLPSGPAVLAVSALAREALLALTTDARRSETAIEHLRAVVVDELASAPEQPLHLPQPRDPRLRQVVREVERDLTRPRGLGELAREVGVGERTLSRLFRQETGMGYRQWRLQLRVHRALVLLAGGASVTDVAAACGWATTSQFIDQFTPLVGMTPGVYRRRQPVVSGSAAPGTTSRQTLSSSSGSAFVR